MEKVLLNLANIDLINFCREQGIDCSGTSIVKIGRGFTYSLVSSEKRQAIATVSFSKNSVPSHYINQ